MRSKQTPSNSGKVSPSDLGVAVAELAGRYRRAAQRLDGPNAAAMADLLRRLAHECAALTDGPIPALGADAPGAAYELDALADLARAAAHVAALARAGGQEAAAELFERHEADLEAQETGR